MICYIATLALKCSDDKVFKSAPSRSQPGVEKSENKIFLREVVKKKKKIKKVEFSTFCDFICELLENPS